MSNKLEAAFHGLRDPRWEDMYACVSPYTVDINDQSVEFVKIGFYVWYNGGFYWTEQNLNTEDVELTNVDLFSWLMNEMVGIVDDYLDGKE